MPLPLRLLGVRGYDDRYHYRDCLHRGSFDPPDAPCQIIPHDPTKHIGRTLSIARLTRSCESTIGMSVKLPCPMGAGKTAFYQAHFQKAIPTLVLAALNWQQQQQIIDPRRSFAFEDMGVDTKFLDMRRPRGP